MHIYFLGGGNMASAIIAGLVSSSMKPQITVIDHNAEKRQKLIDTYHINAAAQLPSLNEQDVLVLATKPQDLKESCASITLNNALVLSLAAGVDVDTLSSYLKGHTRIIRTMPNTPAQVGLGITGLYGAAKISQADKDIANQIMASVGTTVWLDTEDQIHDITCISGSGPAYVFYLMDALFQAAKEQGFSEEEAHTLALGTFKGAVTLAEKSPNTFAELQQNVTSKGGTTHEAIQTFREANVAEAIAKGVLACRQRSEQMQKIFSEEK